MYMGGGGGGGQGSRLEGLSSSYISGFVTDTGDSINVRVNEKTIGKNAIQTPQITRDFFILTNC